MYNGSKDGNIESSSIKIEINYLFKNFPSAGHNDDAVVTRLEYRKSLVEDGNSSLHEFLVLELAEVHPRDSLSPLRRTDIVSVARLD